MGHEQREHIQALDCHGTVGLIAQNYTLDWVWLQPRSYLQFGFLGIWFLCLTYGEISELLRLWIPPRIYNDLIHVYQPGNYFTWSSHTYLSLWLSSFITLRTLLDLVILGPPGISWPLFSPNFCPSNNCLLETSSYQNAFPGKLWPGLLEESSLSAWWLPLNICS